MTILDQLSSQTGARDQAANRAVAERCLEEPTLLHEVAEGLVSPDAALAGDCAEVMTKVAESRPELVVSFAPALATLLNHDTSRVRWEATHALALISPRISETIGPLLPRLAEMIESDPSVVVRDNAVTALGGYGGTSQEAAEEVFPILEAALRRWDGKHAGRVLQALAEIAPAVPELHRRLHQIGSEYAAFQRPSVQKAARLLIQAAE
jgi:HEAT repeat protein